jgi:hypothetical protein
MLYVLIIIICGLIGGLIVITIDYLFNLFSNKKSNIVTYEKIKQTPEQLKISKRLDEMLEEFKK